MEWHFDIECLERSFDADGLSLSFFVVLMLMFRSARCMYFYCCVMYFGGRLAHSAIFVFVVIVMCVL